MSFHHSGYSRKGLLSGSWRVCLSCSTWQLDLVTMWLLLSRSFGGLRAADRLARMWHLGQEQRAVEPSKEPGGRMCLAEKPGV